MLSLGTAPFGRRWPKLRPRPLPSRSRPSLLQAPPHALAPWTHPHRSVGKLPGAGKEGTDAPNSTWLGAFILSFPTARPQVSSCSHLSGAPRAHSSCSCPCPSPVPRFSRKPHLGLQGHGAPSPPRRARGGAGRTGPLRGAAARTRLTRAATGLATRSAQAPLSRPRRSDGWRW